MTVNIVRPTIACVALLLLCLSAPVRSDAQDSRARQVGTVPRDVARETVNLFNAPLTRRVLGDYRVAAGDTLRGNVAVLNGRTEVAGVVTGHLFVINGDMLLQAGSSVGGNLTVLGGAFEAPESAQVNGNIRVWSARLRVHIDADTLVLEQDRDLFARWSGWRTEDRNQSTRQFFVTTAHTYNRVEGLPIYLGPRARVRNGDTRVEAEALGIFRTGESFDWVPENLGHRLRLVVRQGDRSGFLVGGRLFNEVDAVEQWQLSDTEIGLSSFVFTRDYRDYWQRHGGAGFVGVFGPSNSELTLSFGEERWSSRRARNVPSMFNSDKPWRMNPRSDDGVVQLLTLNGTLDSRNRADDPRSGWYLQGSYERGSGTFDFIAPTSVTNRLAVPAQVTYGRALVDLRRYNRLARSTQLNVRAVGGSWLHGNPLPLQRRFAVSGLDALPGYDFRQLVGSFDTGTCAVGDPQQYASLGRPAQCERMVLLQAEWKGAFRFSPFGDPGSGDRRGMTGRFSAAGSWVVFTNSGRGWLVNETITPDAVPTGVDLSGGWRTDVGGGFDFGAFGVYVAKALSDAGLPANVYVRLGRRF